MISKITYFLCAAFMLYASFIFYPKWNKYGSENTISYDAAGYYWYLPSLFIYKDLKHQAFNDSILKKYKPSGGIASGFKLDNGNYVLKYPCGLAIMSLPFFTIANIVAKPLGYPQDGFSPPYPLAIQIGGILIALLGLWYFRKLLLLFYNDAVVAISLFLLVFGTNYLDFGAINLGMTHSWLFTLYVFLILNSYYFYKTPNYKYAIRIGLLIGFATLTRPTEIISALIPLLWGLEGISASIIKARFNFLLKQWKKIVATGISAALIIFIQLSYWKYVSGHWLVYSYQGQGFSWKHPHVLVYACNFLTGWLNYAPMIIFALIGIIPFVKYGKNKVAILAFILINYYIVSAWDIWWYGGRAMIQSYPMLFFPFATLIDIVLKRNYLKWITAPIALLLVYFNLWLTYQEHGGSLFSVDNMSEAYYWRVVGRWQVPEQTIKLRDNPDLFEGEPKNLLLIYENNLEKGIPVDTTIRIVDGKKYISLDKQHQESAAYKFSYQTGKAKWLRAQASFSCTNKEWELWKMTQFIVHFYKSGKEVKVGMIRVYRFLNDGENKELYIDIRVPHEDIDTAAVSFWNAESDKPILIDNIKVWSFD